MTYTDMLNNWKVTVHYMDDVICEKLHNDIAPCTNAEFLDAYMVAHEEKFGEAFEIN